MEDTPMEEPIAPLTEPAPDPTPSPPEPDSTAPQPEAQPKPAPDPTPSPPEPDTTAPEPEAQPNGILPEPTAQPDSVPSEPTTQTNSVAQSLDEVLPPPQPAAAAVAVEPPRKKRKVEEVGFEKSTYFKIRNIVKNLRPLFLQVSENPNFRETNVPSDIVKEITTVLEQSRQLRADLTAFNEPLKPSSIKEELKEHPQIPQTENTTNNSTENDVMSEDDKLKDEPKNLEDGFKGSYVVGGSPIGWNYLVYPGSQPVYYGQTKAEKRACQIAN